MKNIVARANNVFRNTIMFSESPNQILIRPSKEAVVLSNLTSQKCGRVISSKKIGDDLVLIDYIYDNSICDPAADPVILGTIKKDEDENGPIYKMIVFWDDQIWEVLDKDVMKARKVFIGIKADELRANKVFSKWKWKSNKE